jgi:folate-binding protein YgfZ
MKAIIVIDSPEIQLQYAALRRGKAVVELSGWSSIAIRGKDRHTFLHNFCTNDVKRLTIGASCEAFFTNVKGKTIGHGLICSKADELRFLGAPGQAPTIVAHLDRYVIREDVQLLDTSASRKHFLVAGADGEIKGGFSWSGVVGDPCTIVGEESGEVSSVLGGLIETGFVSVAQPSFDRARIETGFPMYGVDFDENNLPQEVGRGREAISFTKGCYLGQETVARIDALGHVNQQIVGVKFPVDADPATGGELSKDDAIVGRITSVTFSPELNAPLALAMIRRGANSVGTRLASASGECEVVEFPARKIAD